MQTLSQTGHTLMFNTVSLLCKTYFLKYWYVKLYILTKRDLIVGLFSLYFRASRWMFPTNWYFSYVQTFFLYVNVDLPKDVAKLQRRSDVTTRARNPLTLLELA